MHDTGKRFLVIFNGWPVASGDTETEATEIMTELRSAQERSLESKWPLRRFNLERAWKVKDSLKETA